MNVQLEPGTYVLAVSGGVDSMSLLHRLDVLSSSYPKRWRLIVAHVNHGIRVDADQDFILVREVAQRYRLPFVYQKLSLGVDASEEVARKARYDFLRTVQDAAQARAIITAHHQDDLFETALINMMRGTDRRGMTAMLQNERVIRPLTNFSKQEIIDYAKEQGLTWREDSTNSNTRYTRNYLRQTVMPKLSFDHRATLAKHLSNLHHVNHQLDHALINSLHIQEQAGTIDRVFFNQLPHTVAREMLAMLLRSHGIREYDRRMLERLVVSAKTGHVGQEFPVKKGWSLVIHKKALALRAPER